MKKRRNKPYRGRTKDGRVPQGRTLTTADKYLPISKNGKSDKQKNKRPVVVIEADSKNNLAVVPLSSKPGKNRTRLKNYQQGKSYFKHFVEIEDNEGKPIRVNNKFRENSPNMDISQRDIGALKDIVFKHSKQGMDNQKKIQIFRNKDKKSPRD